MDAPDAWEAGEIRAKQRSGLQGKRAISADTDSAETDGRKPLDFMDNIERHGAPDREKIQNEGPADGGGAARGGMGMIQGI